MFFAACALSQKCTMIVFETYKSCLFSYNFCCQVDFGLKISIFRTIFFSFSLDFATLMSSNNQRGLKSGFDLSSAARRREEANLSLRNKKREELLEKKRKGVVESAVAENPFDTVKPDSPEPFENQVFSSEDLPRMIEMIKSQDTKTQGEGLVMLRKLLSAEHNPPIQAVLDTGCLPLIMQFLQNAGEPKFQFEAAWILTNIASGEQKFTHAVVEHNAINVMLALFQSPAAEVREQCVWAIGNIAGDGPVCRDQCLAADALPKLVWLMLNTDPSLEIMRNAVWTLSNLCRGKPSPDFAHIQQALPVATNLLTHTDDEVAVDAAWAVSYISDSSEDRINMVIEAGVVPTMIQFLSCNKSSRQVPAIRTIGNIVTGSDEQTQVVIDHGALLNFNSLLSSPKRHIRKESLWTLSNIAAGTRNQVQAVLESGLVPSVIAQLGAPEFEVRKEATWVISNIAAGGDNMQVRALLEMNIVAPICDVLSLNDTKATIVALEALDHFLRVGREEFGSQIEENQTLEYNDDESNPVVRAVIECGGLNKLDSLQNHKSDEIYHLSSRIIDDYFTFDQNDEDMQENGEDAKIDSFQF